MALSIKHDIGSFCSRKDNHRFQFEPSLTPRPLSIPTDVVVGNLNNQTAPTVKTIGLSPADVSIASFGPDGYKKSALLECFVDAQ